MGDYHVHLHPHGPYGGTGPLPDTYPQRHIEQYVEAALARGEDEVGFTEHLYRCVESAPLLGEFWNDPSNPDIALQTYEFVTEDRTLTLENYVAAIVRAKEDGLPVLLGLEVDYFPETIQAVSEFLSRYPFDFLIGSVHWIGAWSIDHSEADFEFVRRGEALAYEQYFEVERQLAASGAVDSLAHCDVVKKHGRRYPGDPTHLYEPLVAAAAVSGTAVEVSSSGLRSKIKEPFPAPALLDMFQSAGVGITTASDAHYPELCASDFDVIKDYARVAGYTQRLRFRNRRSESVPL